MDIKKILEITKQNTSDEDALGMILSNRITHYLGDKDGTMAIGSKNWDLLISDVIKWHEFKQTQTKTG